MKSPEYWQKRAEARMSRGMASADEVLRQLEQAYAKAAREIQGEVRKLYERYGDEYGLSYADAIKDIEQSTFKEWRMTLADYVERINATGSTELLRELNTLSTRSRVTRLQTLEAAVKVNISELTSKGEKLVTQLLSETYTGTYYRAAYDLQRGVGFGSALEMLAPDQVAKAISYPWSGADYSARIWKNADALTATLQEAITQGLVQGKDIRQMTAAIQDATGAGLYNAQRLVRTETAYAVESAELRSYADSGVEQYEVLVSLDERACKKCGARDGEVHAVADAKTSVNYPPFHSNCRCTTVAHFSEEQLAEWERLGTEYTGTQDEPSKRFARGVDGKGVMLPGDIKYSEWKEQFLQSIPTQGGSKNDIIDPAKVKRALHSAEMAIKDLDYETGVIIGRDGTLIHTEKGNAHSVDPPRELLKDNIFTHNHPSGGCFFSVGDVQSLCDLGNYEMRAVTRDGRFVSLKRGAGELNKAFGDDMNRSGMHDLKLMLKADVEAMKKYGRGKYSHQQIVEECEKIVNDWVRENAPKYGYEFAQGEI